VSFCHESLQQYAEAEPWRRKWLAVLKEREGATSPAYATELAALGRNLLLQQKGGDAAAVLAPCLALRQKQESDAWTTFDTQARLGEALLLQKSYTEAEPLLVAGYEGMAQRAAKMPADVRQARLAETLDGLVRLCDATDQKDKADAWRKKREVLSARPPVSP
jgi:hypothetical protein